MTSSVHCGFRHHQCLGLNVTIPFLVMRALLNRLRVVGGCVVNLLDALLAGRALRRLVRPDEVAEIVAWLGTATAVTGQTVIVHGGRILGSQPSAR